MKKFHRRKKQKTLRNLILLKAIFTAYRKTPETEEILKTLEKDKEKTDFRRIRCPLCRWCPRKSSRWFCADCDAPEFFYGGCGTLWNTFETGGKCPTCQYQWRWTSCLNCRGWSLHEDWYKNDSK
jgi:hypothetical protein